MDQLAPTLGCSRRQRVLTDQAVVGGGLVYYQEVDDLYVREGGSDPLGEDPQEQKSVELSGPCGPGGRRLELA